MNKRTNLNRREWVQEQQLDGLKRMLLWAPTEYNGQIIQYINKIKMDMNLIEDKKKCRKKQKELVDLSSRFY